MEIEMLIKKVTSEVLSKSQTMKYSSNISYKDHGILLSLKPMEIAVCMEHSMLNANTTLEQTRKACEETREYGLAAVCVLPWTVKFAVEMLKSCKSKVCTVAGFPYGAATTESKVEEIREAVLNGADEIDVYMNTSAFKSGEYELAAKDLEACVKAAKGKADIKIVIEMGFLSEVEKIKACGMAKMSGAFAVKASNFLGTGKATLEEVSFLRNVLGPEMGLKVDGGIRDFATAKSMILAGATRLGLSASVAIMKEASKI